jgi:signal transduction histidine kinase
LWGAYVGARRDLVASLRERAVRAEDERERRAEQARLAERARIAREMHDVLAHKVSLIALQAGGLEVNPTAGPERVAQTAGLIRATAREALEDLRGVLGVLRGDQSPAVAGRQVVLAPQPGLADIAALVGSSRAAGVRIEYSMRINSESVPDSLGRTVYRIVQEAMTNVHKHARGAATNISISGDAVNGVVVRVINRQPVSAGPLLPGAGSGLIGLRERLALQGGTLTAGPTDRGGWQVEADLPGWRPGDSSPAREFSSPDSGSSAAGTPSGAAQ